jgi:hypothetical protein
MKLYDRGSIAPQAVRANGRRGRSPFTNPRRPCRSDCEHFCLSVIFIHMGKQNPAWLQETRNFCDSSGIKIVGWGPELLTVEAKSDARASEIAFQLGQLGFKPIEDEDNAYAGLLDLSKNPAAIQAKKASLDVSRRLWNEQIRPVIWAFGSLLLIPGRFLGDREGIPYLVAVPMGLLSLVMFFWDGVRIWGWKLEILPEGIRIRRRFRWNTIPWKEIQSVTTIEKGVSNELVVVKLVSRKSELLGKFHFVFARRLRDRLRIEIAQRRGEPA